MGTQPEEIHLAIRPNRRFEIVDVAGLIHDHIGAALDPCRMAAHRPFGAAAYYAEPPVSARLGNNRNQLALLIRAVQGIFPRDAGYVHDCLLLRDYPRESQK